MVPLATRTVIGCTGDRPELFSAGSELTVATGGTIVGVALVVVVAVVGTLGAAFGVLRTCWVVLGAPVWVPVAWEDADGPFRDAVPAEAEDGSAPSPTVIRPSVERPGPVA